MQIMRFAGLALALLLAGMFPAVAQEKKQVKPPEPPAGVKALRDIEYVANGHERQKLDLYLPEKADGPLPLVVWVHGGGWQGGSKERNPALFLTTKGYAVASINYRLSQHATFPAQIEDCKAALRWLRAHAKKYNFDPERVGVWGGSAGGHLVALLGTAGDVKELEGTLGHSDQSSRVRCVVDWFGPADFGAMTGPAAENADGPVARLLGGAIKDNKDKAALASPITHVSKDDPPFLIMHGDMDKLVPLSQSVRLTEALKKAGVEVTLKTLEGAGHGGEPFTSADSQKLVQDFFDKHLKKASK